MADQERASQRNIQLLEVPGIRAAGWLPSGGFTLTSSLGTSDLAYGLDIPVQLNGIAIHDLLSIVDNPRSSTARVDFFREHIPHVLPSIHIESPIEGPPRAQLILMGAPVSTFDSEGIILHIPNSENSAPRAIDGVWQRVDDDIRYRIQKDSKPYLFEVVASYLELSNSYDRVQFISGLELEYIGIEDIDTFIRWHIAQQSLDEDILRSVINPFLRVEKEMVIPTAHLN